MEPIEPHCMRPGNKSAADLSGLTVVMWTNFYCKSVICQCMNKNIKRVPCKCLSWLKAAFMNPFANFFACLLLAFTPWGLSFSCPISSLITFCRLLLFSQRTCSSQASVRMLQWSLQTLAWPSRCRGISRPGLVGIPEATAVNLGYILFNWHNKLLCHCVSSPIWRQLKHFIS